MNRKEYLKTMFLGLASIPMAGNTQIWQNESKVKADKNSVLSVKSSWERWPDINWTGPGFWGNRLQDWQIRNGKVACVVCGANRTLHQLQYQLGKHPGDFSTSITIELTAKTNSLKDRIGFRIGAKAGDYPCPVTFQDYRRDAIFGKGLEAGIYTNGNIFIGDKTGSIPIDPNVPVRLTLNARKNNDTYNAEFYAVSTLNNNILDRIELKNISSQDLVGNIALLSDFTSNKEEKDTPAGFFYDWNISGKKLKASLQQTFGPICFSQYTLHEGVLKMTTQLAPVEKIKNHKVILQVFKHNKWETIAQSVIDPLSRTAHFRKNKWNENKDIPYKVVLELPLKDNIEKYSYEGIIAANPVFNDQLKAAVFSCNCHYGFPNNEVVENTLKHRPDLALFLGDQFYENHGGFRYQKGPLEKSILDYLHKWYMFGWSYRDIFKNIPSAFLPDDHDVYHGNVWGEAGKKASVNKGWGYNSQDGGGYKMPAAWVNVVQKTQTSNLPDPYDATPVKQHIGVYYTHWNYGNISFAILEDRKFKSAPKNVLPPEAKVMNGFIQNPDFNIKDHSHIEAALLGERQIRFLDDWTTNWNGAQMKAVISQTTFCTLQTLPKGTMIDEVNPRLPIPEKGHYIPDDMPMADMDSNGWPQKGRNKAIETIRKSFAFHIAGDQHLPATIQYGVDEYGDSGFAFAAPALNNIWPRRWWPPLSHGHKPLLGRPLYTGDFDDAFGNKLTVVSAANPYKTHKKPSVIYDRVTGYGIIVFDKTKREIKIECWPRYVNPSINPDGQYDGWPIVIKQDQNYGKKAKGWMPGLQFVNVSNPVIELYDEKDILVYSLRVNSKSFTPKTFSLKNHRLIIRNPETGFFKEIKDISASKEQNRRIQI
ncbi:alkaline phosphatase D family protein [Zhouia spongiae]|uniref:Alkaline phosphatase D family protein n=1 Tax=Zhouia spongiae TaxID=2202721 RepID=A0ABY3YJ17_9FLAO|nr:alkaline phosphatase D family protein [Zhouia spongiae]UNY97819.1 alkaline phosphatase D family protein [Zhouia spongiae]